MKRLLPLVALCFSACAYADDASDASQIFAIAEDKYAVYFKPVGQATQTLQGYLVRYYPQTNTYLGVRDGAVYVQGIQFGVGIIKIGKVSDFLTPATGGAGTGGTSTGGTNTGTTTAVDITDLILTRHTTNCGDYAGSYKSTATDFTRSLSFTGNLAVSVSSGTCTFTSNNIPNHTFGQGGSFATQVSAQSNAYKVTTSPTFATQPTALTLTWNSAVLLNGVRVDMLAAACYGVGDGKIGCDNESQAWRYDPLSSKNNFGTDNHNAHVQPDGSYHYHGNPKALFDFNTVIESPVVGFAADGFPLFGSYFKDSSGTVRKARSSYRLKSGTRSSTTGNPGGTYDGTYRDDYEFVSSLGDLDACNGMTVSGSYGYYITDDYPYMTNCFMGTPDSTFRKGAAGSSTGGSGTSGTGTNGTGTNGTGTNGTGTGGTGTGGTGTGGTGTGGTGTGGTGTGGTGTGGTGTGGTGTGGTGTGGTGTGGTGTGGTGTGGTGTGGTGTGGTGTGGTGTGGTGTGGTGTGGTGTGGAGTGGTGTGGTGTGGTGTGGTGTGGTGTGGTGTGGTGTGGTGTGGTGTGGTGTGGTGTGGTGTGGTGTGGTGTGGTGTGGTGTGGTGTGGTGTGGTGTGGTGTGGTGTGGTGTGGTGTGGTGTGGTGTGGTGTGGTGTGGTGTGGTGTGGTGTGGTGTGGTGTGGTGTGGTGTGGTGTGGTSTGGTSSAIDITDLILSRHTSNCADYAGTYTGTAKDFTRNLSFTDSLAVTVSSTTCTFTSNDIPNHTFGQGGAFATQVSAQNYVFKMTTAPAPAASTTVVTLTWNSAVLLNGVKVDMFAAACYGVGDGKIGCDNESQAWRYDPMSTKGGFGTDNHNAHVQPDGAYHYHGNPRALFDFTNAVESPVVGFAADGYPLFGTYFKDTTGKVRLAKSSYRLKTGTRASGTGNPGGTYDGTYRDDYEYVSGLGDLDACNGMTVSGSYGYYITDAFPYMTNCFKGTPDSSFRKGPTK